MQEPSIHQPWRCRAAKAPARGPWRAGALAALAVLGAAALSFAAAPAVAAEAKADGAALGAFDGLFELSRGNLRAIDHLALKSLEIAARAGRDVVETPHLIEARKQLWP